MQLKPELVSLSQRLIPGQLAKAFGIATDDTYDSPPKDNSQRSSNHKSGSQLRKTSPPRKRQLPEDAAAEETVAAMQPTSTAAPVMPQVNMAASIQQDSAMAAAAHAAASMHAASAMAQVAASMQTDNGLNAGYQHPHAAAAAAAAAGPAGAAVMNPFGGFPAYRFNPHTLVPYMGAAPQAMAMSNMTGSMGCPPLSMYSGPADYGQMVRPQEEEADDTQARALKRPRLVWTPQLHKLFEEAVSKLGLDKAVPKTIMQFMNVEGLTRENVASHLQKYRLSLKKTTDGDSKAAADGAEGGSAERDKDAVTGSAAAGDNASGSSQDGGAGGSSDSSGAGGSGGSSSRRCKDGSEAQGGYNKPALVLPRTETVADAAAAAAAAAVAAADASDSGKATQQQQQQGGDGHVHQQQVPAAAEAQ